jgi:MoxR-like ATPase
MTVNDAPLLRRPLRAWFPSEETAETCLSLFADLVLSAHESGPARWALSLRDARTFSLSVGMLLVFRLSDDGSAVVAVDTDIVERLRPATSSPATFGEDDTFVKAPGVALLRTSGAVLATDLAWMRPAIEEALRRAIRTVRTRTSYFPSHTAEAVRLLAEAVGRELPDPDYRVGDAPTADGAPAPAVALLSEEQLRAAWRNYVGMRSGHVRRAEAVVHAVRDADAVAFRSEEVQRALWKAPTFASAGPGESIDVSAAYADDEVLDRLAALRTRVWPSEVGARAAAIRAEYDAVLERIGALGLRAKPMAKLARAFAILVPEELAAVLQTDARARLATRVLGTDRAGGPIETQVKVRGRLRQVLGPERDLSEHVARVTFCWWLQGAQSPDTADIVTPEDAALQSIALDPEVPVDAEVSVPIAAERVVLWPFGRQYRGIASISGYAATWRDLLRAAQAGQTASALIDEVRQGGASSSDSVKALQYGLARMLALGLAQRDDGVYRPTEAGFRVLEGDNDPLIESLLVRNYGFAQVLRRIATAGVLPKAILFRDLRGEYPQWTSDFGPSSLLAWTLDLGLTESIPERAVRLTEYGAAWHARLPDTLPVPPALVSEVEETTIEGPAPRSVSYPKFDAIEAALRSSEKAKGFVLDRSALAALHAGWTANPHKHFVILSGLSGTGKTAVLRHYARAVCGVLGLRVEDHVRLVTVSPDWHDPTGLLGYFNALGSDPSFQPEPAVTLLHAAQKNPERPYFLILDEMNLARVERYLAPLLSAMESGEPIAVHGSPAEKEIPQQIPWPRNLYLAGTVNMDESTYPFSDKVLDRAFTLEFWDVDLPTFFARREGRHESAEALLLSLHDALAPARRHFGYRTAGEVLDFVTAMTAAGESETAAMDHAVFAKVLPKLRGEDDPVLRAALSKALKVTGDTGLTRSRERLALMLQRLERSGVTRFWS